MAIEPFSVDFSEFVGFANEVSFPEDDAGYPLSIPDNIMRKAHQLFLERNQGDYSSSNDMSKRAVVVCLRWAERALLRKGSLEERYLRYRVDLWTIFEEIFRDAFPSVSDDDFWFMYKTISGVINRWDQMHYFQGALYSASTKTLREAVCEEGQKTEGQRKTQRPHYNNMWRTCKKLSNCFSRADLWFFCEIVDQTIETQRDFSASCVGRDEERDLLHLMRKAVSNVVESHRSTSCWRSSVRRSNTVCWERLLSRPPDRTFLPPERDLDQVLLEAERVFLRFSERDSQDSEFTLQHRLCALRSAQVSYFSKRSENIRTFNDIPEQIITQDIGEILNCHSVSFPCSETEQIVSWLKKKYAQDIRGVYYHFALAWRVARASHLHDWREEATLQVKQRLNEYCQNGDADLLQKLFDFCGKRPFSFKQIKTWCENNNHTDVLEQISRLEALSKDLWRRELLSCF